mmetsp:Transcript_92762/g.139174  ORF Transcript_92762/g.139174 Transcript_92762/m.139174 type:complete len:461 (+) Transcript_92762:483-1865(+)
MQGSAVLMEVPARSAGWARTKAQPVRLPAWTVTLGPTSTFLLARRVSRAQATPTRSAEACSRRSAYAMQDTPAQTVAHAQCAMSARSRAQADLRCAWTARLQHTTTLPAVQHACLVRRSPRPLHGAIKWQTASARRATLVLTEACARPATRGPSRISTDHRGASTAQSTRIRARPPPAPACLARPTTPTHSWAARACKSVCAMSGTRATATRALRAVWARSKQLMAQHRASAAALARTSTRQAEPRASRAHLPLPAHAAATTCVTAPAREATQAPMAASVWRVARAPSRVCRAQVPAMSAGLGATRRPRRGRAARHAPRSRRPRAGAAPTLPPACACLATPARMEARVRRARRARTRWATGLQRVWGAARTQRRWRVRLKRSRRAFAYQEPSGQTAGSASYAQRTHGAPEARADSTAQPAPRLPRAEAWQARASAMPGMPGRRAGRAISAKRTTTVRAGT